jgi:hypothetical protein
MSSQNPVPYFPTPPNEYNKSYMAQVIRAFAVFAQQVNNPGPIRGTTLTLNPSGEKIDAGEFSWNVNDATADLTMEYGVTQQIGMETYARVSNTTGTTIPNGTVVGFAGATSEALLVSPYIADGTMPSLYVLGVMTHDLPDSGQKGYCTTWGFVRDLNTSAFAAGDILYASPTTAGALTKTKPTAPNNVTPVAACVVSDAVNGVIFVRPTIEQQKYYGVFSDTTTQTPVAAYTPYAMTFNTTDFALGFARGAPTSRIVAPTSGLYNFQFSAQLTSSNASAKTVWIWIRKNGIDVSNSGGEVSITGNGEDLVAAWNWIVSMNATDYLEIMYASSDVAVSITAHAVNTGANGTPTFARPAVPSVILTVTEVQL